MAASPGDRAVIEILPGRAQTKHPGWSKPPRTNQESVHPCSARAPTRNHALRTNPPPRGPVRPRYPPPGEFFHPVHYLSSFVGEGMLSFLSDPVSVKSPVRYPCVQGQLLNHAPPVPNAFLGVPVFLQVPPRSRALVPTLDRHYCDQPRHLLTYHTSRTAPASGFRPGEIPKSLGVLM